MSSSLALFLVLGLTCAAFGTPSDFNLHSLSRQRREADISVSTSSAGISGSISTDVGSGGIGGMFGAAGYVRLVEELIQNLNKAAQQAREAVITFGNGLQEEAKKCQARFQQNIEQLKGRISKAVSSVTDKFSSSGSAVQECVKARTDEAHLLINTTMEQTTTCTNERLKEAGELISGLTTISDNVKEYVTTAFAELRSCQNSGNFFAVGSCMGNLAIKTETKGAVFLAQTGLQIARLDIYMATLPASLELCAGSSLVNAGIGTAKIVMEIGTCSASSIFSTFTGNSL